MLDTIFIKDCMNQWYSADTVSFDCAFYPRLSRSIAPEL